VPLRHKGNDNQIDRKLQKSKSYTGIQAVSVQDAAVQDSQGPIADRTRQHLGILRFRKLMMDCTRDLANGRSLTPSVVRSATSYAPGLRRAQEQRPRHRDGQALRRSRRPRRQAVLGAGRLR
jgi:hypothetical protein